MITNSRWCAYATAGAASAFISANSAEATIHYGGIINHWFDRSEGARFQLDQVGDSLRLSHTLFFPSSHYGGTAHFGINGRAAASFAGFYNTCPEVAEVASVSNLNGGQLISNRPFLPRHLGILAANSYDCDGGFIGQFDEGDVGFIGFKFNNGSGDQYGWVRIQMGRTFDHNFKLIDYAYGDVGDRIRTGQKGDRPDGPELESLGGLALGAVGVLGLRKRRSQTARLKDA